MFGKKGLKFWFCNSGDLFIALKPKSVQLTGSYSAAIAAKLS